LSSFVKGGVVQSLPTGQAGTGGFINNKKNHFTTP